MLQNNDSRFIECHKFFEIIIISVKKIVLQVDKNLGKEYVKKLF